MSRAPEAPIAGAADLPVTGAARDAAPAVLAAPPAPLAARLAALGIALRPHQWTKNLVIFAGLVFSEHLFRPAFAFRSVLGFALFCALSSGVYLVNDIVDRERDRLHPRKRARPIPSGRLSVGAAGTVAAILLAGALTGGLALGWRFAVVAAMYAGLNLAYSLSLKNVVILDVMLLSSGFVLRAVAGVKLLTPVDPQIALSPWLLVCTLFLALFLAIAKRRAELRALASDAAGHRKSLSEYSLPLLDQMTAIVTAGAVLSYSIYTVSPDTVAKFGTTRLVYTVPFVLFGIFRYLYLVTQREGGGNPSEHLLTDRPLLAAVGCWAVVVVLVIYGVRLHV